MYEKDLASRLKKTIEDLPNFSIIPLRIQLFPDQKQSAFRACNCHLLHIDADGTIAQCGLALRSTFPPLNIFIDDSEYIQETITAFFKQYSAEKFAPCIRQ